MALTQKEFQNLYNTTMMNLADLANDTPEFCEFLARPCEDNWRQAYNAMCAWKDIVECDMAFYSGATKAVIVDYDEDYVVKMPFLWMKEGFDWSTDKEDWGRVEWNKAVDYCQIEWRNYAMACDEGLGDCFAATYYLGEFEGCPIYIQERHDCDEDEVSSESYDSAWTHYCKSEGLSGDEEDFDKQQEDFSDHFYDWDSDEQMEDLTCDKWGAELATKFWDFCHSAVINDLHTGNWACNERLVVVDYSGYGDTAECAFVEDEWCRNVLVA